MAKLVLACILAVENGSVKGRLSSGGQRIG